MSWTACGLKWTLDEHRNCKRCCKSRSEPGGHCKIVRGVSCGAMLSLFCFCKDPAAPSNHKKVAYKRTCLHDERLEQQWQEPARFSLTLNEAEDWILTVCTCKPA
eukprot:2647030-Amphidinium_carterae.1